jgi:chromosome segregation ATPase
MMACGTYDFLLCTPSLPAPAPDVVVDRSSFNDLPMEERLAITQRDLQHMKEALHLKESDQEDLQQEMKFHAIKNEELMDVINAFRSTSSDRSHEIMRAKAEQNSELTVQVHSLRDILTKSGDQIAALQKDLKQKTKEGEKLASYQRNHQRLQVQLKGLVKTLNKVEISNIDIPSEWINLQWITGGVKNKKEENDDSINLQWITGGFRNKKADNDDSDKTIQDITQKIIVMEADRQRILKESQLYNQSDGEKEKRILALERQVRKMQHDQDELQETNKSQKQQLAVREGKIGALEELFQSINTNRAIEGAKGKAGSPNRRDSLLNVEFEDDENDDCESVDINSLAESASEGITQSFEEMFTSIWTNFTGGAATTDQDDQEISSCFNDSYHTMQVEVELKNAAKANIDELKERQQVLTEDYEAAQFKISGLSAKLEDATIKANSFQTKAKLRESLLKDVIQQYKELQMENSASNDRMVELKRKVAVLLQLEKQRNEERKAKEAAAGAALVAAASGKIVVKGPSVTDQGETSTFDMSERSRMTSEDDSSQSSSPSTSLNNGLDNNFVLEENKLLVGECDRLQHEFDSAIEKINDLEESLQEVRDEFQQSQSLQADQSRTIALLEGEKTSLQDQIVEVSTKVVGNQSVHTRTEDDLILAELREQKARDKQMQREKDLWEVIEQYKRLADENRSTQEEMAEVEHELMLTQKVKIQRRDLVYEFRKLEKGKKLSFIYTFLRFVFV